MPPVLHSAPDVSGRRPSGRRRAPDAEPAPLQQLPVWSSEVPVDGVVPEVPGLEELLAGLIPVEDDDGLHSPDPTSLDGRRNTCACFPLAFENWFF